MDGWIFLHSLTSDPPPVATGFPAGQTPLETRLQEVRLAVAAGATEVDVVIDRCLALTGQWQGAFRDP